MVAVPVQKRVSRNSTDDLLEEDIGRALPGSNI
jgi:hypothetical protein